MPSDFTNYPSHSTNVTRLETWGAQMDERPVRVMVVGDILPQLEKPQSIEQRLVGLCLSVIGSFQPNGAVRSRFYMVSLTNLDEAISQRTDTELSDWWQTTCYSMLIEYGDMILIPIDATACEELPSGAMH